MIFRAILWVVLFLISGLNAYATHNRAGEITYRHMGGFQYEATIITYTKSDSPADRPELGINWGDGFTDTIPRVNGLGAGEMVAADIKKNIYVGLHTYPAPAVYILSFEDPNRNGGVVNIPNSVNVPFYVSTQLIINPFLGINNSVRLLNPPIDEACPGRIFIHNPGAYDPDGDSISFRLTECRGEDGEVISGFVQPTATNSFTLDPITGDLVWDTPPNNGIGEYNVAFVIEEWRNGVLIGWVTRDMQINVVPCQNQPPQLAPIPDICVDAGTSIGFEVLATDSDSPVQLITLSASGGPFLFPDPGQASFPSITAGGFVSQQFNWNTSCDHVRKEPYIITFKAIDSGQPKLATYETMQVKVVAQAPENLVASPQGNTINLTWQTSPCQQAIGYAIYRRNGFYGFNPNPCETGVPAYTGYTLLDTVSGLNALSYTDGVLNTLLPARNYCYMVVALFPDGAESYASEEACAELADVLPVITHVSVLETAQDSGKIYVEWSKPNEIDTVQWPGPYRYVLERAQGQTGGSFVEIAQLNALNDTTFIDSSATLNTAALAWQYRVRLEEVNPNPEMIGQGLPSSSVRLQAEGSDNTVTLSWAFNVLWENDSFAVFRKNLLTGVFDSIGVTTNLQFADTGLANGQEYCYLVKSYGAFTSPGFESPLINFSQEICQAAQDLTPPCAPGLLVEASCDSLYNWLKWTAPSAQCASDAIAFRVYYKPQPDQPYVLLETFPIATLEWIHEPGKSIAGCYAVAAVDSFNNESALQGVCVDNCPIYELPNVFSPNGDGLNDAFRPFPYAFIESVAFTVFNRWGQPIFETDSPDLGWNGRINNSGSMVTDGVYYYICVVQEIRLQGLVPRVLKGTIQVIDSANSPTD